jgi:hypothetical protein
MKHVAQYCQDLNLPTFLLRIKQPETRATTSITYKTHQPAFKYSALFGHYQTFRHQTENNGPPSKDITLQGTKYYQGKNILYNTLSSTKGLRGLEKEIGSSNEGEA